MSGGGPPFDLSVVVPSYRNRDLLLSNLPHVLAALERARARGLLRGAELLVADDASDDGSEGALAAVLPDVRWLRNPVNRGFSGNARAGIEAARHELLFLLNSDARPEAEAIAELLAAWDRHPSAAALTALQVDGAGTPLAVGRPLRLDRRWRAAPWPPGEAPSGPAPPTLFPSGGAALFERGPFLAAGAFEPLLAPHYVEDLEWGLRLWRAGGEVRLVRCARVIHEAGTTIGREHAREPVRRIRRRNARMVRWLHWPPGPLLRAELLDWSRALGGLLLGRRRRLAVSVAVWARLPALLRRRRSLSRSLPFDLPEAGRRLRARARADRAAVELPE